MNERQAKLLKSIIHQYIKTAQPIGSGWLAENFNFSAKGGSASGGKISPATIRNEMADLTNQGFLAQPYTSAGRIPTEKAYRYFVEHFLSKKCSNAAVKKFFKNIKNKKLNETTIKEISKKVAEEASGLVVLAFSRNDFYYTGLSYLFGQPEFQQAQVVYSVSQVVDHLDETMADIFDKIGDKTEIFLGRENPFSELCSTILIRFQLPKQKNYSLFGLLGPMRMDYERNLSMVNYIKELLTK